MKTVLKLPRALALVAEAVGRSLCVDVFGFGVE